MKGENKFGIAPSAPQSEKPRRRGRGPGPMSAAIRDAADNLRDTTDAKVEQRRKNAADAKAFREAEQDGRLLVEVAIETVRTDDLPRDRLDLDGVAGAEEMEELKASIKARGQREAIELYRDPEGALQLKSGWRRLTALRQLRDETGDARFAVAIARIDAGDEDRVGRYVDMAEENVIREDLSFAEMAQLALVAAADPAIDERDPEALVGRLYTSLHKVKRSYIRSFVQLLAAAGPALRWPKAVPRNLGVEVARRLKKAPELADGLRSALAACGSEAEQARALEGFLASEVDRPAARRPHRPKEKYEFHLDGLKVTARRGECRILGETDFTMLPREKLEKAIAAFRAALSD